MDEFHPVLARMRIAALQSELVLSQPNLWNTVAILTKILGSCLKTPRQMALSARSGARSLLLKIPLARGSWARRGL